MKVMCAGKLNNKGILIQYYRDGGDNKVITKFMPK